MPQRQQLISIQNSLRLVKKAEDPFAPLKEAITNSFDAIKGRLDDGVSFTPRISLIVAFKTRQNTANEEETWLDSIKIEDNGIGFIKTWFERYVYLAQDTKQMHNRGTGKLQMFHRFKKISIDSTFYEEDVWKNRKDVWNLSGEATGDTEPTIVQNQQDTCTSITLEDFYGQEEDFYIRYLKTPPALRQDILKRFLLRLYISNKQDGLTFNLTIMCNDKLIENFEFNDSNIPKPDKEESINIHPEKVEIETKDDKAVILWKKNFDTTYVLDIKRFTLPSDTIDENTISMCSKNIEVEKFPFSLGNNKSDYNGYRYITSISGDILNDNVNDTVDKFTFKKKSDVEKYIKENFKNGGFLDLEQDGLYREELNQAVTEKLNSIYSDVKQIEEENKATLLNLAKQHGISEEIASSISVELGDNPDKIVEKMYVLQAKNEAKTNINTLKKFESLKQLNPTSSTYRDDFNKISKDLLSEIPQQNKDELARYIIRRNMVVDLLRMSLANTLDIQEYWKQAKEQNPQFKAQPEKIIQNLIFPKGKNDKTNNLWILNEEFVHFDGYADTKLEDIEINGVKLLKDEVDIREALRQVDIEYENYTQNRPDICLFPEEGKCIIIEFKAPDVDLSEHTSQISKYAKLIANYSREQFQFNQFFGFLIGEKVNLVKLDTAFWKKVPFGEHRVYPNKDVNLIGGSEAAIANLYQEMILLSGVANRAELRNKSFADKLGITPLDLEKVQELQETQDK